MVALYLCVKNEPIRRTNRKGLVFYYRLWIECFPCVYTNEQTGHGMSRTLCTVLYYIHKNVYTIHTPLLAHFVQIIHQYRIKILSVPARAHALHIASSAMIYV